MAVDAVFISSAIGGFEDVREAAAKAISASGLYPIRSEELSADPASSRRALLDQVAAAEYYLLLLGARYGGTGPGGPAQPRTSTPRPCASASRFWSSCKRPSSKPRQRQFLEQVRGGWGDGVFHGTFTDASDIGAKIADAFARQRAALVEDAPAASERAITLAAEQSRHGWNEPATVRAVFAPLRQTTLLDPIALEDRSLADDLIAALRAGGAVPQSVGVTAEVSAAGVRLGPPPQQSGFQAQIHPDGAIVISSSVAGDGMLGGMQIDPERLAAFLGGAGRAAQLIWDRIDTRSEVGQVAVTAAVLDAQHLAYGNHPDGSVSLGGSIPATVITPDPPAIAPRAQLDQDAVSRQAIAAIRRVFADAGRVQQ